MVITHRLIIDRHEDGGVNLGGSVRDIEMVLELLRCAGDIAGSIKLEQERAKELAKQAAINRRGTHRIMNFIRGNRK